MEWTPPSTKCERMVLLFKELCLPCLFVLLSLQVDVQDALFLVRASSAKKQKITRMSDRIISFLTNVLFDKKLNIINYSVSSSLLSAIGRMHLIGASMCRGVFFERITPYMPGEHI